LAARLAAQLGGVETWEAFIGRALRLDADAVVPADVRARLDALPASLHLYGDRVPLDYDVEPSGGVVRLRLKEGQARRLRPQDLPALDRPVRFTVIRGKRPAVRADSLEEMRRQLADLPRDERTRLVRGGRRPRRR
jgi:hypothetical protein